MAFESVSTMFGRFHLELYSPEVARMLNQHDQVSQDTARKQAPSPSQYPYALVGEDGVVLTPKRFDGTFRAAVFLDLRRARLGQLKWGGTVVDRYSGERF